MEMGMMILMREMIVRRKNVGMVLQAVGMEVMG
jgi:hypothetical protein